MENYVSGLEKIDWDFSDYNSQLYPADINFLHWYPGVFVPQIPSILINALSNINDVVLDPFAGSGITLLEASRIKRRFIGVDINPYAIKIIKAKIFALTYIDGLWYEKELKDISGIVASGAKHNTINVSEEVYKWFHPETLNQLLAIRDHILKHEHNEDNILRFVMFSSILNRCSSQREHYTYITDKCFPKTFVTKNAIQMYIDQVNLTKISSKEAICQYQRTFGEPWTFNGSIVHKGDSRDLSWIESESVDLIVTSPPYLGVNDYTRSMYLTELFFKQNDFEFAISNEIGARRKRHRKTAYNDYIEDMKKNLLEAIRVLKDGKYLALIIGKGGGKVNVNNPIEILSNFLYDNGLKKVFGEKRKIKFRRIQVTGVGSEWIHVFRKAG